ncbi:hypothetical protein BT96DRAFT_965353 [Gymnopus androsaceus JB14]|uniref:R3H domain-containing protein n=1 Tax=Gymnopus androsaceus JB14 TaxID=1447944 RepID=A0A6A4HTS7_9AGAR|nr:hypothetical protein BT96DRAFT_965353 [Gymnopus androsaceus JB14]
MDSSAPADPHIATTEPAGQKSKPPRRKNRPKKPDDSNPNQGDGARNRNKSRIDEKGKEKVVGRIGKAKFNAGLTADPKPATESTSSAKPRRRPYKNIKPQPDAGDLTSNLIRELSKPPYLDCLICLSAIHPAQPTWSCSLLIPMQDEDAEHHSQYCWTTFHLKCIKEWSEKSYKEVKAAWEAREEFNKDGEWRCPGCQGRRNKLIKGYVCFCGSIHSPNNRLATPHSCGNACSRPRNSCAHLCPLLCHPGPCPPCKIIMEIPCGCPRQKTVSVRCGENPQLLGCGKHRCEQICHLGPCSPCEQKDNLHCCPCHSPTSNSGHCPMSPDRITSCPCGKQPISVSSSPQPGEFLACAKCTNPIPACASICLKAHPNCEHSCQAKCHTSSTISLKCGDLHKDPDMEQEILCTRPCTAMRACGKHQCTRICCPLASLALTSKAKGKKRAAASQFNVDEDPEGLHQCDRVCGKTLSCGARQCEERDHRGPCKPCLRSSFEELVCFCGQTVLEPPVPCGTRIHCSYPCSLPPPPCGHSKTPHTCHFPDTPCPPCPFLTHKSCACGKKSVPNMRCSLDSDKVSCGLVCGKLMPCGYHKCDRTCHAGECGACSSMCGKARKLCLPEHHPCTNLCHAPTGCDEDEPCQTRIEVSCECGRIRQAVVCGRSRANTSGAARAKGQVISCTAECALKKRNARLAEALGIKTDASGGVLSDAATYSDEVVAFSRTNAKFLTLVEDTLAEFVKSSRTKQVLPSMPMEKRSFVHNLASVYRLDSQMVDQDPHRSVQIIRRIDTRIPNPLLSAYIASKFGNLGKLGNLRGGPVGAGIASSNSGGSTTNRSSHTEPWPGPAPATTPRGWTSVVASPRAVVTPPMRSTPSPTAASSRPSRTTVIPAPPKPASTQVELLPTSRASGAQGHTTTIEGSAATTIATGTEVAKEDIPDDWEDDV